MGTFQEFKVIITNFDDSPDNAEDIAGQIESFLKQSGHKPFVMVL
jgi:hypothetical protein